MMTEFRSILHSSAMIMLLSFSQHRIAKQSANFTFLRKQLRYDVTLPHNAIAMNRRSEKQEKRDAIKCIHALLTFIKWCVLP